ncbi:MAG: hypothetical protein ACJ72N_04000 [Labedaea sp.]
MPPDDREPTWFVLLEETVGTGDRRTWSLTEVRPSGGYDEAVRAGRDLAFSFQPRHPMNPRQRSVFQSGDDCWIVVVQGAIRSFHFRVTVARWLGDAPG